MDEVAYRSQHSSAGIVSRLRTGRSRDRGSISDRGKRFLFKNLPQLFWALSSYPVSSGDFFLPGDVKVGYLLLSNTELKNRGTMPPFPYANGS
jgi:hypothetical protein